MSNDETEVDLSEWSEIDTSGSSKASPKVEFEIEEEVTEKPNKVKTVQKEKVQEVLEEEPTQEQPEELEGIKTKGAEKRIKQLIRSVKNVKKKLKNFVMKYKIFVVLLKQEKKN
jgi:uncharacterized protein involved in exopolysaccharide biosynthesis